MTETSSGADATVSFGDRQVAESERQRLVNDVFGKVAERYDLMNDLMSGGLHRLWKDDLIGMLAPPRGERLFRLLDVAGGTADVAIRFARSAGTSGSAVICDISSEMLAVGRRKIDAAGLTFGIRNVTHIERALAEAFRVVKLGGRFLCLEFSHVDTPILDRLYDFHSFEVIPRLGQLAAGDSAPYRYLVESIRRFPSPERFAAMIREAGFERVSFRSLTGGIAAIHSGWRI
jgi:demethylmenaquinone methyltransferase/2-methoxy-6-polyprenyl-1,4-benzoquinol methylase